MWLGLHFSQTWVTEHQDQKSLIAGMAYAYSDQLRWINENTLVIEILRSKRLHSSLEDLVSQLLKHLSTIASAIQHGIASNPAAASLLAPHDIECWTSEELLICLNQWPIQALPINLKTQNDIIACGLKTLGELKKQPKDQRIRRFGRILNDELDRLYGDIEIPQDYWRPSQHYYRRVDFIHPIEQTSSLQRHIHHALADLDQWLQNRDGAITQIRIRLKHEKRPSIPKPDWVIDIGLAEASSNQGHLQELIKIKLESISISQPLSAMIMECKHIFEHSPKHDDLFNQTRHDQNWPMLLDRLKTQLGPDALFSLAPCNHHQPEKSWQWMPPNQTLSMEDHRIRPTWIMEEPIPYRRNQLILESGPERIETGWWQSQACQRDYWVARDCYGRQLWVFKEHQPRNGWFIHGIFG